MSDIGAGPTWMGLAEAALADLWAVLDAHFDEVMDAVSANAMADAEVGHIVRARPPEMRQAERAGDRQRLRQAFAGDWEPYEAETRARAAALARIGIGFRSWFEVTRLLQSTLLPHLVAALAHAPERMQAAIVALQSLADRMRTLVADEYRAAQTRLLEAERELSRRSEDRYRLLFDHSPAPTWVYDLETHKFLAVNQAVIDRYGYTREELLGMTIEQIRFAEDLPRLRDEEAKAKGDGPQDIGVWRHRTKSGQELWVELRLHRATFAGRDAHLIVAIDVTKQRTAARSLQASEERYRSLVAATSSVVWTADSDGRFTRPQPSWQAYTGQTRSEYADYGWLHAIHPDDRARLVRELQEAKRLKSFTTIEGRLWHATTSEHHYFDGRAVPLFADDGSVREWMGTVADIDLQKKVELPGRFFALSLDLLCIAGADGYFQRVNPAFHILGYSESELLARPILDFVHPDDRAATKEALERLGNGESAVHFEGRFRSSDGEYRDLIWSGAPDPAGVLYLAARDISDRKRTEAERSELNRLLLIRNEELIRASRTKSDFLAMMSHELRTPLNSIIGFSEVLIDGKFGALNEKQERYTSNVLQSGRHLLGLINDLLDLSKVEAGRFEVVRAACPPRVLVAEAVVTLQPVAQARNVDVQLLPASVPAAPPVFADGARCKQVLYNLLSNAIKFSPPGGKVVVSCAPSPDPGFVRFGVRDFGPGIAAADLAKLFEPFTQLAGGRERGGTGLGLALAKQLVELMGGHVGVESEPGQGSLFTIDLPIASTQPPAPTPGPTGQPPAGTTTANPTTATPAAPPGPLALVVEDDASAQELLVLSLQAAGYRTLAVRSGDEALAQARMARPDVITLDVFLPAVDGWDVLRRLKQESATADIPVVMVTVSNDRAQALNLGAVDHLLKPVTRETLWAALARLGLVGRAGQKIRSVLAVDDDVRQLDLVRATLEPHGFGVRTAHSGRAGLAAALEEPPDLILLDLVMPDLSGIEVVAALRADPRTRQTPVLLVTGHTLTDGQGERLQHDVSAVVAKDGHNTTDLLVEIRRVLGR